MKNAFAVSILAAVLGTVGQPRLIAQATTRIEVSDPRPMMKAIDALETRVGMPINYEDLPLENADDLQDYTDQLQSAAQRSANPTVRIIGQKNGELSFDSPLLAQRIGPNDLLSLLTQLRAAYEAANLPGRFVVAQRGSGFAVEPGAIRTKSGAAKSVQSVLSTPISIPFQQRSAAEWLKLICDQVGQRVGAKIGIGVFPMSAFANANVALGGSDQPANSLLSQLFAQVSATSSVGQQGAVLYSYRLLFDAGLRSYGMNVHPVGPLGPGGAIGAALPGGTAGASGARPGIIPAADKPR